MKILSPLTIDAITATTAVTIEESDTYLVVNKRLKKTTAKIAKQLVSSIIARQQKLQLLYHHGISRKSDTCPRTAANPNHSG